MKEKKTNFTIFLSLVFLLLLLSLDVKAPILMVAYISEGEPVVNAEEYRAWRKWNLAYERIVDSIKLHECYMPNPYYCRGGHLTVGYGHAIRKIDHFTYPMSRGTADSLLRSDFNAAIEYVKSTTTLTDMKLLAMGHFVFCLGSGSFQNSKLKQVILANGSIDKELLRWVNIRTKHGKRPDKFLKRLRLMELQLFNTKA